jgi:hypothetical protein
MLALLLFMLSAVNTPAAPPTLKVPLLLTIRQTVGMAPLTLRVKVRAEAEGREVCVVVEGPESMRSCRTLWGVTWTQDFLLRAGGEYAVYAVSQQYRTPDQSVRVIGMGEPQ